MNDVYYSDEMVTVHHGDCIEVMRELGDESVHAVVTDPPYGLEFMGREWDGADGFRRSLNPADAGRDSVFGRSSRTSPEYRAGHLFEEWTSTWAAEALRVLKPGGHLLAFGGSRTWHRLAAGIEDAGFEVRDSIAWLYGSGFPKSLDVSKAIDKAGGVSPADQAAVLRAARSRMGLSRDEVAASVGCTPSSVRDWEEGRARAAGEPIEYVTPSAAYRAALADLLGYTADERRIVGASVDRRGDGTVIGLGHSGKEYGDPATPEAAAWQGWGTALKPAFEPIVVARKPLGGTVAANVLQYGTGALNIDANRVGSGEDSQGGRSDSEPSSRRRYTEHGAVNIAAMPGPRGGSPDGRWPANVVLDESQAAELDRQSGITRDGVAVKRNRPEEGRAPYQASSYMITDSSRDDHGFGGSGGASRFFPTFRYEAKARTSERPRDGQTAHPTVKPLDLMRWLVRLVTPPGGTVLEPFAGSGTTLEAALLEGFSVIGIEREAEYLPLIRQRLSKPLQQSLFGDWEASA